MRHPAHTYRQFSVQGATPLGLVVMLYDGAIAALQRAVTAIEAHDIQKKCNHLNRALAIIAQLEGTLNLELGGEVAQTLKAFYVYARAQALKPTSRTPRRFLRSLIEKFATVREAWYEAEHRPSAFPRNPPDPLEKLGMRRSTSSNLPLHSRKNPGSADVCLSEKSQKALPPLRSSYTERAVTCALPCSDGR